ncbi:MAG: Gfo/Idh/MocA family oxidoreductase [Saprospiraceae bacterium]|nr:Gfo/Idh/MocA family oxidoreductase [Saprospiraceae bacterium]
MVGGGRGAFIGGVHRIAANMDGLIELVAGAFSSDPAKSKASGSDLMLAPDRCYGSYEEMILSEKQLPEDKRIDIISIVTPNHMHYEPAKLALESGFDVICDKPLSFTMSEALDLQKTVTETGRIFALTHNYTGYPMVKQARCMIRDGKLGTIRKLVVEYPQGWLTNKIEGSDHSSGKQATWRTDPLRSGIAGSMGDIGTHAENLAEYITGLQIEEMCADISVMVPGRLLDDDGNVLLHMNNGARGILFASQISAGEENNLKIRVYGEYGGLEWSQHEPNTLILKWHDRPTEIYRTGVGDLYPEANAHRRIPAGHPEGYLEAFANIYRNFALAVIAKKEGRSQDPLYDFPTVADGVRGMQFIESVISSGKSDTKWVKF